MEGEIITSDSFLFAFLGRVGRRGPFREFEVDGPAAEFIGTR